jgi:tetratricopeptide (TPR) repeat protein
VYSSWCDAQKLWNQKQHTQTLQDLARRMPAQYVGAEQLVRALGGLPLALDQAGAYIEETRCSLPAYLELFRARRVTLLRQRGERAPAHPESVAATFTLAITATAGHHPAVWDLLRVCALLQPDAIPEELFHQGAEHLGETLAAVVRDLLDWDRVVGSACSYSLLHQQPEEQTLPMHRLLLVVLLDTMGEQEQEQWGRRVIEVLEAAFPGVLPSTEYAIWQRGERLLLHALLCLQRPGTEESYALASLGCKAAHYLRARGRYVEAEPLYQRMLRIREQVQGSDHLDVATSLNNLASLYLDQGRYTAAEPLYLRCLPVLEQALGPEHPLVAPVLNNLALVFHEQGSEEEAEPLYQRALHILEQVLGPEHPETAQALNNLANLCRGQGRDAEAELLYQRALHIGEQSQGGGRPEIAMSLVGLASLCRDQGKYTEARQFYQRALSFCKQHPGEQHPDTAQVLHDLAILHQK